MPTCREPEQIELVRQGRRALVRCHEGRALEVFDLRKNVVMRRVAFNGRATDLVVSPDGEMALVTLTNDGVGGLALVDLQSYAVTVLPLSAEPTRVRLTADGRMALVLSDPEGGNRRRVREFTGGQGTINVPCWAPDSSAFAYVRYEP